ncbi:MAG: hypothetical protein Q3962_01290 [Corynebacterium sp.]|nr:hypothetical protein [Corynebacterium sp.]
MSTVSPNSAESLDKQERRAGRIVDLGPSRGTLIIALVLYIVALFLPHSGAVKGFDVLLHNSTATAHLTTMPEYVQMYLTFLGLVVFNILVLLTRNSVCTLIGWCFSGVGLFYTLFAMWMRQTHTNANGGGISIGLVLSAIAVFLAVWGYTGLIIRRTSEQQALADARVDASRNATPDPVADAQLRLMAERAAREAGTYDDGDHRRRRNRKHD